MMPELASLKIVAWEEGGKFIGQRIIPIIAMHPGKSVGIPSAFVPLRPVQWEHKDHWNSRILCSLISQPTGSGTFKSILF